MKYKILCPKCRKKVKAILDNDYKYRMIYGISARQILKELKKDLEVEDGK